MRRVYIYCVNCKAVKELGICEHSQMKVTSKSEAPALHVFEPYYDRTLKSYITSERDKEKKMKKFKNSSHPEGLYDVRDDKKFLKEMAYIQKHREEYKAMQQPGYKPMTKEEIARYGKWKYDPNRPDFNPNRHRN